MTSLPAPRARRDRAFARMYRRHVGDVYRYTLAVLRHPEEAEEITRATFLTARRAFEHGARPGRPRVWLVTIAHEFCYSRSGRGPHAPDDGESAPTVEDIHRAVGRLSLVTCAEAERVLSRRLDVRLPRRERGRLREHLRECGGCAAFDGLQRQHRVALRAIASVPLPDGLASVPGTDY